MNFLKKLKSKLKKIKSSFSPYSNISFSQEGEDIIINRILGMQCYFGDLLADKGFYVDIGSHHPLRFSNTYSFYQLGWCGINVDPLPGSKKLFDSIRPRDINLELGIANINSKLNYFSYEESALNTFDESKVSSIEYEPIEIIKVNVQPLSTVLTRYLVDNQRIDFLNIDVEGFDLEVLQSNDWSKFRPKVINIEIGGLYSLNKYLSHPTNIYLAGKDYSLFSRTRNSFIYIDNYYLKL